LVGSVADELEARDRGLGQGVHFLEVELGELEVRHRSLFRRCRAGAVEFLERAIGMMPDRFLSGHGNPLPNRGVEL
jgi:hypothetical protein